MNRTYNILRDSIIDTFDTMIINADSHARMLTSLDQLIATREAQHAVAFTASTDDVLVASIAITAEAFRQERQALGWQ